MSDQTPIPADAIDLRAMQLPPLAPPSVEKTATEAAIAAVVSALNRFEQPPYGDLQCSAGRAAVVAIRAAAPILLAAGRTAAAADIRAEIVGLAAYEDIRIMNAAFEHAARVAENGADR